MVTSYSDESSRCKKYCLVAVDAPFNNSILTYLYCHYDQIYPGMLVMAPLGKRKVKGCVLKIGMDFSELSDDVKKFEMKFLDGEYCSELGIFGNEMDLYRWISEYYHYPLGQLIFDCLPKIMKKPRRLSFQSGQGLSFEFSLNEIQKEIIARIKLKLDSGFSKWLVHGITGSGKTAVYLELVRETLKSGKSALFLLPEINLTPQFIKTFLKYIDAPIYSYNSSINNSDKFELWKFLQKDQSPKVIIGVRSSIYLPIKKLGLIVVDEEHDQSFKQEDRCPYNARDIAIKKASLEKIPVVLGSATPSLETFNQFVFSKRYHDNYFQMKERTADANLPKIELVDMRTNTDKHNYSRKKNELWPFNSYSLEKIKLAVDAGEQVLVFVNRLGFANYLQCRSCGHQFGCPNCTLNLKYFRRRNELSCQYCNYIEKVPEICPECQNMNLHQKGFGTERLQDILEKQLPEIDIERFDRDDIKTFKQLEERLKRFHSGEIDILVGTQMLSKGHNFKNVNLVLVLGVDDQLNFPDFRSNERVYQLLTQISGRSGRFGKKSEVLIHTLGMKNKIFQYILNNSFDDFYRDEIEIRKLCACPPFLRIAMVYFTSRFKDRVDDFSNSTAQFMKHLCKNHFKQVELLGPRPAMIEKRVNKFTWSLMIRSDDVNQMHNLIKSIKKNIKLPSGVTIRIDVDPYHLI